MILAGTLHTQAIVGQIRAHPISISEETKDDEPTVEKSQRIWVPKRGDRIRDRRGNERIIAEVDLDNHKVRLEGDSPYTWTSLKMVEVSNDQPDKPKFNTEMAI